MTEFGVESGVEARLRTALRFGAAAIFVVTPLELVFTEHTGSTLQLFPFFAAGLGVLALATLRRPGVWRRVGHALLVVVCLASMLGMWEHFEHNFAFEQEIHPNLASFSAARSALFGASPALAPGILMLGACLAWASAMRKT